MAFIIDYKAPHKLTLPHLRLGLRPMDMYEEVFNRDSVPAEEDQEALFQYHADRLAASALTQAFDYMIQSGFTYGCVTTGECFVFLKIDWAHPIKLLYHLAEPGPEVEEHRDNLLCCTAVSQVLAFTMLALDWASQPAHGQDERQRAMDTLKIWEADWESILQPIPDAGRTPPPTSLACEPRTYKNVNRSPHPVRPLNTRGARGTKRKAPVGNQPGHRTCPGGQALSPPPDGNYDESGMPSSRGAGDSTRQYCTQKCLLGLATGDVLD